MGFKLTRVVVAALIPLTLVPMVQPSTANAVTYGDPVENPQVEYPEVVPVWVGGTSLCSGTLVTQQVVLTAAHCVYGKQGPFQVSVGGSTLNDGRLIDIDATWYHPRYDAAFSQNDLALLHLKTPAGVSRLGSLPKPNLKSVGKRFLIVGWGRDQNGNITGKLHRLSLNEQGSASRKFFRGSFNPKTMIGAGRYFADEVLYGGGCTGDSGGPLYQGAIGGSRIVVGLTSFGARGCTVYQPTVFTRVDFYVSDIIKGIQLLDSRSSSTPIATGKATPVGVGPTTTTTTIPLAPLAVSISNVKNDTYFGGLTSATVSSNLIDPWKSGNVRIVRLCLTLNGLPMPAYQQTGTPGFTDLAYPNRPQSSPGCYSDVNSMDFLLVRLPVGTYSLTATMTDSIGRTATSAPLSFSGYPAPTTTTTTTTMLANFTLTSWNGSRAIGKTARNTAWTEACFYVNDAPWSASLGTGGGQSPVSGTTHCVKNDYLTGWSTSQGDVSVFFTPYTYSGKYSCTYSRPCTIYAVITDALGRSVTTPNASLVLP
jgi:hypothetical protein